MQAVDLAYRIKLIERSWHLNTQLPLQIAIQLRQEVLQEAEKNRDDIVFWIDGSKLDTRKVGSAIVWLEKSNK